MVKQLLAVCVLGSIATASRAPGHAPLSQAMSSPFKGKIDAIVSGYLGSWELSDIRVATKTSRHALQKDTYHTVAYSDNGFYKFCLDEYSRDLLIFDMKNGKLLQKHCFDKTIDGIYFDGSTLVCIGGNREYRLRNQALEITPNLQASQLELVPQQVAKSNTALNALAPIAVFALGIFAKLAFSRS